MAAKKRKSVRGNLCSTPVGPSLAYAEKSPYRKKIQDKEREEIIKKEIMNDIALINVQINQLLMTIGHTTKIDEAYTMRQQMLDLLRFKYNILESY